MRIVTTQTPMEKIDLCRKIVDKDSCMEINSVIVDIQSANAIVKVFEDLNESNQAKFIEYPIIRMGEIAWTLIDKAQKPRL